MPVTKETRFLLLSPPISPPELLQEGISFDAASESNTPLTPINRSVISPLRYLSVRSFRSDCTPRTCGMTPENRTYTNNNISAALRLLSFLFAEIFNDFFPFYTPFLSINDAQTSTRKVITHSRSSLKCISPLRHERSRFLARANCAL